jgi:GT2 family glycosyltransferase
MAHWRMMTVGVWHGLRDRVGKFRRGHVLVSLVVVNYNSSAFLKGCAQAAMAQVDEIIVVDNASVDGSIETLLESCPNEPKLKVVRNGANLGFAVACNIGSELAKGDYVLFLNPDCRLDVGVVAEMKSVLESNVTVGMVGGLLVNLDGSEQGGGRRAMPTPWRSFVHAFGLSRFSDRWPRLFFDFYLHKQPLPALPIEVEAISGACMLVKRKAMEDVGPWDEKYFLHCEDLDWCMRFQQKGWKVMFVPSARVTHALGVCGRSCPVFVEWHKHKGMMRFYRKFFQHQYPGVLMGLVMMGVWLRFGLVAGYYTAMHTKRALGLRRG